MQKMCRNCFKDYEGDYDICPICGYVQSSDRKRQVYHLPVGMILHDRYRIGRVLGCGGFGSTYKAWDMKLGIFVAIKEYYPNGMVNRVPGDLNIIVLSASAKAYEHGKIRFLDEARNTAKFRGEDNIVEIYEYFEENNTAYFVMEYLGEVTLRAYLSKSENGRLDVDTATKIVIKVAEALEKVHKAGIIHRDIAPDNIFICTINGVETVKLIDFGAARFANNEDELLTVIFKPGFAPPEQYNRSKNERKLKGQGPWTDVYALGATMYYLITGVKAEESTNRKEKDSVPYPHEIDPSIPVNISNAVMKAMAVDRHMRFQSVTEFKKAIKGKKKVYSVDIEKLIRAAKRVASIVATLAIVTAGALLFYHEWTKQKEEESIPVASIEVWCTASEDYDLKEGFSQIAEQFKEGYNNDEVVINVTTFPKEEYLAKLKTAIDNNEAPDLFESTGLDDLYLNDAVDLSEIVKEYYKKNCSFYKDYLNEYSDYRQIPLAFNYPVAYINNVLYKEKCGSEFDGTMAGSIQDILDGAGLGRDTVTTDCESFFKGEYIILEASTGEYMSVVERMAGKYKLVLLGDVKNVDDCFDYEWSVISDDKDKRKVAERFLEFMLSGYSQSELEITPNRNMLPVNKKTLDMVVNDIFGELSGIMAEAD